MWNHVGMARNEKGLETAIQEIRQLRDEFWQDVKVMGTGEAFNQNLEHAGRVADFLEFGELLAYDALHRDESCGGHFREEHATPEGECDRNDEQYCYVAAWESNGVGAEPSLHKEPLEFHNCHLGTRSYK
jgi:succinate dehydrogenase / fumarate reductase flavoprotein subunit